MLECQEIKRVCTASGNEGVSLHYQYRSLQTPNTKGRGVTYFPIFSNILTLHINTYLNTGFHCAFSKLTMLGNCVRKRVRFQSFDIVNRVTFLTLPHHNKNLTLLGFLTLQRIQTMSNNNQEERDWNGEEKAVLLMLYSVLFAQGIATVSLGFICLLMSVLATLFAFHLGQEYNNAGDQHE